MADYTLHLTQEENIVLGAGAVRRLIDGGSGDAALLYLCLARRSSSDPDKLRAELRWSETRLDAAARELYLMGLIQTPVSVRPVSEAPAPPSEAAVPEYSREDVMNKLESDASFAAVLAEVERKLGRLSDPSVRILLELYDYLGLSADVVLLLVNYCIERRQEQFGKLPTMRDVKKEGYAWARMELFTFAAADAYLRRERKKRGSFPEYMAALRLDDRAPSPGEEKYLGAWSEMGFPAETVAIAYDKTMLKCHELKWPYLNGILKKWHEKGLHTPDEVSSENTAPRKQNAAPPKSGGRDDWMNDYD